VVGRVASSARRRVFFVFHAAQLRRASHGSPRALLLLPPSLVRSGVLRSDSYSSGGRRRDDAGAEPFKCSHALSDARTHDAPGPARARPLRSAPAEPLGGGERQRAGPSSLQVSQPLRRK
jgi:hypothetical protein